MPKKQKDDRYRAKITVGHTTDGKLITKYVSGKTKRKLEEAKAAARAYYVDGAERREDMLFAEYAEAWYHAKKEPFIKEATRKTYITYLNTHVLPAFGGRMMRAIQPLEIQAWINKYRGKSKSMITGIITILKGVFRSAYSEGIIARDPTIALVKPEATPPEEKRAFTQSECIIIERVISEHQYGDMLAVFYYTGLRRGEVLGLQWTDFDWKQGVIHVQRDIDYTDGSSGVVGELKSKAAYRDVPIDEELQARLYERRGIGNAFLFATEGNKHLCLSTFLRRWMSLMIECGFATPVEKEQEEKKKKADLRYDWDSEITGHYFRHHYASMLNLAGVDPVVAMKILGHADYATTAKIYTHPNNMQIQDAGKAISEMRKNKKVAKKLPE